MKKNILYVALLAFAFLQVACENNKEQYLEDYNTILYFRNSGVIEHPIYKPEELSQCVVSVVKAGSNLSATPSVLLEIMDDGMLTEYNQSQGTNYKALPENCYSIKTGSLTFDPSEAFKKIELSFYTEAINAIPQSNYIVPLYLSNASDSINKEKKYMFIKPEIITPLVRLDKTGYVMNTFPETGPSRLELNLPVNLSIENKWSFNCYTEVSQDLLDKYNREQGVNYMLLPANAYTMNKDGIVGMNLQEAGSLKVEVNRESLIYGNYALPILLKGTSIETIEVDPLRKSCLLGVSYVPDANKLKPVRLNVAMVSYHPNSICEGSVAELFDGDAGTYFHSDYSVGKPLPHWLQFALPEECTVFRFEYLTRNAGEHVIPRQITLYGSTDGADFKKIVVMDNGLPLEPGKTYTSPVIVAGGKIKHIRMTVDNSLSGSFALAEFRLWTL